MEYFSGIAGNESLKEYFSAHLRGGRLAHAYLFVGPSGSGKTNFALALAAAMACRDTVHRPCGQCGNCRKILRMQCADLTVVTADGEKVKSIKVDAIRRMKEDAEIFPNDLDFRVFLVDDASDMNVQAQNALLKLLEEPPENVFLFLLASDPSRLLPTVLSRVQAFRMERLNRCQLEAYFEKDRQAAAISAQNPARYRQSLLLADGSVGRARALFSMTPKQYEADAQVAAMRQAQTVLSMLSGMVRSRTALLAFLQDNVADREQCGLLTERLMAAMHDCMLYKKSCPMENFLFFTEPEKAESVSAGITTARAMHCYERLGALRRRLQANLNLNATLCALTMALCDAE